MLLTTQALFLRALEQPLPILKSRVISLTYTNGLQLLKLAGVENNGNLQGP